LDNYGFHADCYVGIKPDAPNSADLPSPDQTLQEASTRQAMAKRKICAPPIIPFAANQIMFDLPTSDRQRIPEGETPIYGTQGI
jgi:hypothetical protein